MGESSERVRRHRERKRREELTVRRARLTAPSGSSEQDIQDRVDRALAYAKLRDEMYAAGECPHPLHEAEMVW